MEYIVCFSLIIAYSCWAYILLYNKPKNKDTEELAPEVDSYFNKKKKKKSKRKSNSKRKSQ